MYPISYEADYVEPRNRVTTFFRYFLAIPWMIVAFIYAIAVFFAVVGAWFALVFTGRYPEGLYNFNSGFLRFQSRVQGWFNLQTDEWPSFGFGEDPGYPIRVTVAPRQESYSRAKAFFRGLLALPLWFVIYAIGAIQGGGAGLSWLQIVFRGRQSPGLQNLLSLANAYNTRFMSYAFLLLTETYPPISEQAAAPALPAAGAAELPAATTGS